MRRLQSRPLCFETLERRTMLAGDVNITVMNNTLFFTGDSAANHLVIEGGSGGSVTVTGANNTRLLFNGVPQGSQLVIAGGFNNISVDLNAGDDTLEIKGITPTTIAITNITIAMDEGADFVRMGAYQAYASNPATVNRSGPYEMQLSGTLQMDTGTGADLVQAISVSAANWDFDLGDSDGSNNNNDGRPENNFFIALDDQAYIFHTSGSAVDVNGGGGDDLVNINYLTTTGVVGVSGMTGNDVLSVNGCVFNNQVTFDGGTGADTVALDFCRHDGQGASATIDIETGSDSDFILFARSLAQNAAVTISTGSGFDRAVIGRYYANVAGNLATGGSVVGSIILNTDSEGDVADIRGNDVQMFFGNFGGGDDNVDFLNNIVRNSGVLDGGLNTDRLTFLGNLVTNFGSTGFEAQDSVFESDFA